MSETLKLRDTASDVETRPATKSVPPKTPYFVITPEGDLYGEESDENVELARRIRACVNACEGITTEELEAGIIGDMRRVLESVLPILQERVATAAQED